MAERNGGLVFAANHVVAMDDFAGRSQLHLLVQVLADFLFATKQQEAGLGMAFVGNRSAANHHLRGGIASHCV
jgi:hypothetical protein